MFLCFHGHCGISNVACLTLVVRCGAAALAATFSRFIPEIKARFDYSVSIFILTLSLVAVSSYCIEELMPIALQRTTTIFACISICLCTTILVCPVWASKDLHKLAANNLDKLAESLEGTTYIIKQDDLKNIYIYCLTLKQIINAHFEPEYII